MGRRDPSPYDIAWVKGAFNSIPNIVENILRFNLLLLDRPLRILLKEFEDVLMENRVLRTGEQEIL